MAPPQWVSAYFTQSAASSTVPLPRVEADLRLGSHLAAEIDKCIGAEMAILGDGLRIQTVHVAGGSCRRQDSKLSRLDSGIAAGN